MRIRIDVTKRLTRGKRVSIEGGESRWINFKYERLPNFCYSCGLLSHSLKDCQDNSANILHNKGELQYGAWLRGEPMRRGNRDFLSSSMEGGVVGEGDTGVRSKKERTQPAETDAVGEVGNTHVPRLEARGDDSLTWDETKMASSMHLTENLHEEGKVNLKEGKAKDLIAQTSEKATDVKAAQPEAFDEMQWEKIIGQVEDPTFKFENKSVQSLKVHAISTDSADVSQGPVAMVYDGKVGWTTEVLGPHSKHWKRLARESKGKSESEESGPKSKKRNGPTPLQELDPNAIDQKKKKRDELEEA